MPTALFGAPGTAALAGASVRLPGIGPPGADSDGATTPWWVALLWALPLVGVGGAGTVMLLRRRAPRSVEIVARHGAMAPVEPQDVRGILLNGQTAVARGALDEAVAWFDAALRLAPTLAVAHFCKGVCLAAHGRVAEAYGSLDEAVASEPDQHAYRIHLARVALALGKHAEAMDALARVTRDMPELGRDMLEDPELAGLRDHPRFLMICGEL
jgi:tetratricopeptide (TPR) repeat protein